MKRTLWRVLDGLFLLRISLLAPVWTIVILGWVTGSSEARPGGGLFVGGFGGRGGLDLWVSLVGFSLIVASIYVVNQIVDLAGDRINHKLFLLPHGIVGVRVAWVLAFVCMVSGLAVGIFLLDRYMVALFVVSLFLGALYNLPPAALKDRAWGGALANFLGHGTATYLVGWHAARLGMTLDWETVGTAIPASLSAGFANAAVFIATTIADAEGDRATEKRTFCVAYGEKATALAAFVSCACALVFAFYLPYHRWVMILPTSVSLVLFGVLVVSTTRHNAFLAFKWPVFLLSALVALFVPPYAVLILVTFFGSRLYYRRRFGIEYPTFKAQ